MSSGSVYRLAWFYLTLDDHGLEPVGRTTGHKLEYHSESQGNNPLIQLSC